MRSTKLNSRFFLLALLYIFGLNLASPVRSIADELDSEEDQLLDQLKEVRKRKQKKIDEFNRRQEELKKKQERARAAAEKAKHAKKGKSHPEKSVELDSDAVDLSALSEESPHKPSGPPSTEGGPIFKAYFDFLLVHRPRVTPISFRNFHPRFLADYIPSPDLQFQFEVSPNPLFYELDYQVKPYLQLRLGKIWIPFDEMNPHNSFGGFMNVAEYRDPLGVNFLPDIWADLGIGLKATLLDTRKLSATAHLYVVNGFGAGGSDPTGSPGTYPNFGQTTSISAADNNTDKAVGARVQLGFSNVLFLGTSAYTGLYTDDDEQSGRISMLGIDSQFRLTSGTEFKTGFIYMKVGLNTGTDNSFERGGLYGELAQRLKQKWKVYLRGGIVQADHRVEDVNDKTVVGVKISYDINDFLQTSLEYHRDIQDVPGKTAKEFTGARFVITL